MRILAADPGIVCLLGPKQFEKPETFARIRTFVPERFRDCDIRDLSDAPEIWVKCNGLSRDNFPSGDLSAAPLPPSRLRERDTHAGLIHGPGESVHSAPLRRSPLVSQSGRDVFI